MGTQPPQVPSTQPGPCSLLCLEVLPSISEEILLEETFVLPLCPSRSRRAPAAWPGKDGAAQG